MQIHLMHSNFVSDKLTTQKYPQRNVINLLEDNSRTLMKVKSALETYI